MADVTLSTLNCTPPLDIPDSLDGLVLNVIATELPNADTSFFYFNEAASGFNTFAMQFTITATTLTVEGTNDLPSVANGSAVWTDITDLVTLNSPAGSVSTITATGSLTVAAPLPWSRLRIRRLTTNATNALALRLTRGRVN